MISLQRYRQYSIDAIYALDHWLRSKIRLVWRD